MSLRNPVEAVEVLEPHSPLRDATLRLILSGSPNPAPHTDERLLALTRTVVAQGLSLDPLVVGLRDRVPTAAAMTVATPGRSAMVHLSPLPARRAPHDLWVRVLGEVQNEAWLRGTVLLQAIAEPGESRFERTLSSAGFQFLAELVYLERHRDASLPPTTALPDLDYVTYSAKHHERFLRGLESTYINSLDCPRITGLRSTEDVLAAHRATGHHRPDLWFLAMSEGEPAGVLLLTTLPQHDRLEVAYMGVAHTSRRRRVGHALMRKCAEAVVAADYGGVVLAVDSINAPARALYGSWGFEETGRRRAWISTPSR